MINENVSLFAMFSLRGNLVTAALIVSFSSVERDWSSVGITLVSESAFMVPASGSGMSVMSRV